MAIYTVDHRSGLVKASYDRSPVITLETDAASVESLPEAVRAAADCVLPGGLHALATGKIPRGADGVVTWFAEDRLIEGSAAVIRRDLRTLGRRSFLPVHLPCLPELDLLCVQPRWFSAGPPQDYWNLNVRIASAPTPSSQALAAVKAVGHPWAQLCQALMEDQGAPGSGVESLGLMWKSNQLPSILAALSLRNLVVLLIRHNQIEKAEQLLDIGLKAYPGYAELSYIAAVLCFRQQRPAKAIPHLERTRVANRAFVGSGGENSYRADWLMGILAARVGNQRMAFEHFRQGMTSRPVFTPAVDELLNLRCSTALVEKHQWDFCRLARREPQYLETVFDYLLLHRAFPAARRIAETMPLAEETRAALRERLEAVAAPFRPSRGSTGGKPGVILNGPFFEHSSLARINREIGASLLQSSDLDACLEPSTHPALLPEMVQRSQLLANGLLRHPRHLALTVRHQWPPDLRRPTTGKLAVILPWEYGAVPRKWVEEIERDVDELWVPSTFVRNVFVRCGVSSSRVQVIPNGIDPAVFRPEGPACRPLGSRRFVFLFVGGAVRRKGVDILLEAYREAFDPGEDVSLVINVSGSNAAYQHNTLTEQLNEFARDPGAPHVQAATEALDDATLASLYRGCDALVLPYRGEGFGMPLVEAMACAKPVVTTALGPSQDFCSEKTAYLVPAREVEAPDAPPPLGELVGEFTWFEPDPGELVRVLRRVYEHPEEAAERGRAAAKAVRQGFTWPQVTRAYLDRIRQLVADKAVEPALRDLAGVQV